MPEVKTLSPDTGLSPDISVSDLGALIGGAPVAPVVAAPAAPVTPAPAAPVVTPPVPEAAAEVTAVAEPEKNIETETPVETTQEPEKPQKRSAIDQRLHNLATKRREAEAANREARTSLDAEKKRSELLQRELEALKTAQPGPPPLAAAIPTAPAGKPELSTFVAALADGEAYETAVERFTDAVGDFRDAQREAKKQQATQSDSVKAQEATFKEDWKAALEVHPDFEDVVERVRSATPAALQQAISQIQDDDGKALWPDLTIYLDEHPDTLTALTAQFNSNPDAAKAKLGRISARLSSGIAPVPATAAQPRTAPKAPVALGGNAAAGLVDLEKIDMTVFGREMTKLGL